MRETRQMRLTGVARAMRALAAVLLAATVLAWPSTSAGPQTAAATGTLPSRLDDKEFWTLVERVSEPGGYFRITDNYTSNEMEVGRVFTMLRERQVASGVYLGVGPEQNFSYIAAIRPRMAFIIDIRRQAVIQHLMFKAVFEMAADRADFISLLFARPRPAGLTADTPIATIWEAFFRVSTDFSVASKNAERIVARLTKHHGYALTTDELAQLRGVMTAFVQYGPGITTRGTVSGRGGGNNVTFADLTGWSDDASGQVQSFLSTEEHFRTVKALHDRNLIVPVSGDFGGPKALRAIGAWLAERGATVSAFYVSNVEQYLFSDRKQSAFYDNVATLPVTDASVFIRPYALRRSSNIALCPIPAFLKEVAAGRVFSNQDATACAY